MFQDELETNNSVSTINHMGNIKASKKEKLPINLS